MFKRRFKVVSCWGSKLFLIVRLTLKDPPIKNNLITVVITGSVSQGASGDENGEEYAINGTESTDFLCFPFH
jgi:hypothetical protein